MYSDGGKLLTLYVLWKTVVGSARQWRALEDSPIHFAVWQTVVDSGSGRERKTVKDSGEH